MTARFEQMRGILEQGRFFKVVCGAGNEDPEEVRKLTLIYTLAGALGIDISAKVEVVEAAMAGIDQALELAPHLGGVIACRPFINVSVGLKGDPHVRKAIISDEICTECGQCLEVCEQQAISQEFQVREARCIGCGACADVCPADAVSFFTRKVDLEEVLPKCLRAGAENIELHAIVADDEAVMADWEIISRLVPEHFISMCLDRSQLSNQHLISRIQRAKDVAGSRLIIQADGVPMSGGSDDFNTTLQAIAIADIVQKSGIPLMLLASGGTNSQTGELASLCGVTVNGVSIGTHARKLVREELANPEVERDSAPLRQAVAKASKLVEQNLSPLAGGEHG